MSTEIQKKVEKNNSDEPKNDEEEKIENNLNEEFDKIDFKISTNATKKEILKKRR